MLDCDVLVVGAGPAGCAAARSAALKGVRTILIDKKREIGFPVHCAEGIGRYLFPYLPFRIPRKYLIWNIEGIVFRTDDICILRRGDPWCGYNIERKDFDKWLSEVSVSCGAELWTDSNLIGLRVGEDGNVKKAIINKRGKNVEVSPKVLVAADGSESTVLKLLNLYKPKKHSIAEVYSWEIKNVKLYKDHFEQIFIGEFTPPGGYAYIFPKSKNVANVGVGGAFPKKKMVDYFEDFMQIKYISEQMANAEFVIEKSKSAVIDDITDKWVYENILLAGDTANQNLKPFIEGILPSIICGNIAGNLGANMCSKKKLDNEYYLRMVNKRLGGNFENSKQFQDAIEYIFSKDGKNRYLQFFGIVSGLLELRRIKEFEDMTDDEIRDKLLRRIKS
jgi:digeranylgeranylglycerophospholipid reductase